MPTHAEKRNIKHSSQHMFDLVSDVEKYPEFLPWCTGARIQSHEGDTILADLAIGYGVFEDTFTSHVTLDRPCSIDVEHTRGPFRYLVNRWRFMSLGNKACELKFEIDFAFRSMMLESLVGLVFQRAFSRMVESFESRAAVIYTTSDQINV